MAKRELTDAAKAAKIIRAELKKNGIAAKVRSKNYSMGSSVDISLLNDPLPATVEKVTEYVEQFQQGHFDGMTDMYEYSNDRGDVPQAKFVFVTPEYSEEIREAASAWANEQIQNPGQMHTSPMQLAINGSLPGFWANRKPRQRCAA